MEKRSHTNSIETFNILAIKKINKSQVNFSLNVEYFSIEN